MCDMTHSNKCVRIAKLMSDQFKLLESPCQIQCFQLTERSYMKLLHGCQRITCFSQFDWFPTYRISGDIPQFDYIWGPGSKH